MDKNKILIIGLVVGGGLIAYAWYAKQMALLPVQYAAGTLQNQALANQNQQNQINGYANLISAGGNALENLATAFGHWFSGSSQTQSASSLDDDFDAIYGGGY